MQWDLLPPLLLKLPQVTVAGRVEPAYGVGGDSFDYAINGALLDLVILDAMGHGLNSALMSTLAVGCYRHDRRESRTIEHIHSNLDAVINERYGGEGFVTGQLAQLHLETGTLMWTNAGHPRPLLVRGGKVIGQLACAPTAPWGVGLDGPPSTATEDLEPGDSVLFFTDGVVEARGPQVSGFGIERLADLAGRTASDQLPAEEIIRHLVSAVLEHHHGELGDDATLVMVQWHGPVSNAGLS
jgi:serine phosphatase RsbU (regulator of sigma subunit)